MRAPIAAPRPSRPVSPPPAPRAVSRTASPAALSEAEIFRRTSLDELNGQHPLGDAFFEYDKFALRDDARTALQRDADWLRKWPSTKIRIEGHCDDRGTPEYNLALGQARAAAVESYLTSLGIPADRITTVSLGKEAPFCTTDSAGCWSQNRRGHFLITAK
jgi:peptidoglycan-associated lipoprotein